MTTRDHVTPEQLGAYVVGEIPEPWRHDFDDAAGAALNLAGYVAKLTYLVNGTGAQVVRDATIVDGGATGKAEYAWVAADLATAGWIVGELWVGNGVNRYAQPFYMAVNPTRGGPAPNI